jgi:hypothetical protein
VDGSGAATWLEKTIYSKVSTVGPDPTGKLKGKCALSHFYKILVIKYPTHIKGMSICQRVDKVQINTKV